MHLSRVVRGMRSPPELRENAPFNDLDMPPIDGGQFPSGIMTRT